MTGSFIISNTAIDTAGKIVALYHINNKTFDDVASSKFSLIEQWRSLHAVPLNALQVYVKRKLKKANLLDDVIVVQRLKRMPSILDKIKRFPKMRLSRMQDVGGIRIIVSVNDNPCKHH